MSNSGERKYQGRWTQVLLDRHASDHVDEWRSAWLHRLGFLRDMPNDAKIVLEGNVDFVQRKEAGKNRKAEKDGADRKRKAEKDEADRKRKAEEDEANRKRKEGMRRMELSLLVMWIRLHRMLSVRSSSTLGGGLSLPLSATLSATAFRLVGGATVTVAVATTASRAFARSAMTEADSLPSPAALEADVDLMFTPAPEPTSAELSSQDALAFGDALHPLFDEDEKPAAEQASQSEQEQITAEEHVRVFRSIRYYKDEDEDEAHPKQALDVYCPKGQSMDGKRDVVIHIHGGGWRRGDRRIHFYGTPSVCAGYAANGIIAVAPSYRLGRHPNHMEDAVAAVKWVHDNIESFGGNPDRVFLSGHSAGGNIVALLVIDDWLKGLPANFIKGVVAMSGVYSLHRPMGGCGTAAWKNWIFSQQYVTPTFGTDEAVLVKNSPACLLRLGLGDAPHAPNCALSKWLCTAKDTSVSPTKPVADIPPFMVLSASWDLGLEADAVTFVELLKKCEVPVQYQIVADTNHASVCWKSRTHQMMSDYIAEFDTTH